MKNKKKYTTKKDLEEYATTRDLARDAILLVLLSLTILGFLVTNDNHLSSRINDLNSTINSNLPKKVCHQEVEVYNIKYPEAQQVLVLNNTEINCDNFHFKADVNGIIDLPSQNCVLTFNNYKEVCEIK